jgi:hypothetical protein
MAVVVDTHTADARAAAIRNRPDVIAHRRTTTEPYEPTIEVVSEVDVRELLGRSEPSSEADERPA